MQSNKSSNENYRVDDLLSHLAPEDGDWRPDLTRGLDLLRARRNRRRMLHSRLLFATVGTVAIAIPLLAFPATRLLAAHYVSACVNLLGRLSGDTANLAYSEVAHRKPAPDVALKSTDGNSIKLSDIRGKVVLLTFSKTNCGACDTEMQWFREFEETYRQRGFVLFNHQVPAEGEEVLPLFGSGPVIPTTFLIDKSGKIAVTHIGLCTRREYEVAIQELLNEP
jgi:peroxiredoxin